MREHQRAPQNASHQSHTGSEAPTALLRLKSLRRGTETHRQTQRDTERHRQTQRDTERHGAPRWLVRIALHRLLNYPLRQRERQTETETETETEERLLLARVPTATLSNGLDSVTSRSATTL